MERLDNGPVMFVYPSETLNEYTEVTGEKLSQRPTDGRRCLMKWPLPLTEKAEKTVRSDDQQQTGSVFWDGLSSSSGGRMPGR